MHNHRPVLARFGSVHVHVSGAVVAELFADSLPVHVGQAVHQDSVRIPVAPYPFALAVFPEPFACKSASHAIGVEYAGFLDGPCEPRRQS